LISAHLQKCSSRLASKIESLQKNNSRLETTRKEIEELKQLRIPTGVRPFNLSYDTPLLDTTVLQEDLAVSWTIVKGTSVREAKKQVYIRSITHQKELDAIIMSEQRASTRVATRQETFVRECGEVPGCELELDIFKDLDLDFDESTHVPGFLPKLDRAKLETKAVSLYYKVVEAAAKQKKLQADSKLKAEQKINKVVEAVKKRSPEELFQEAVSREVDMKLQMLGISGKKQNQKSAKPSTSAPSTSATLFVHRLANQTSDEEVKRDLAAKNQSPPKNGDSPAKGGGKSKQKGGAPKGKGKIQAQPKAAAKGGGKPAEKSSKPSKGQQKGKEKGQHGKGKGGAKSGSKGQGNGKGRGGARST
jgi:hypothetical protein